MVILASRNIPGRSVYCGMTLALRTACVIACSLAAAACGGRTSPSAPTPVAAEPGPAASVAGTWETAGAPFMTLTQAGATIAGGQVPTSVEAGGVNAVITGTVTGTVSGVNVSLNLQDTVTVNRFGELMMCRGADSFTGQASGDTLTGIFISGTTRYVCDRGITMPTPQISGPMTFTRR